MRNFSNGWRLAVLLAALVLLSGCNTMQGAGKDLKRAGEKIEEAARR